LASGQWIRAHQNLVITGATGCGKTWLACALGNAACRQGLSVAYVRAPRLFEELRIAHGDGSFGKRPSALAKTDLLILDDWALAPLNQAERNDFLEVLDDRVGRPFDCDYQPVAGRALACLPERSDAGRCDP
jgi:DNA replication protein DnaC